MTEKTGRPLRSNDQDAPSDVYTFRATAKEALVIRKIGDGSVTNGIRKLVLTFTLLMDIMGALRPTSES